MERAAADHKWKIAGIFWALTILGYWAAAIFWAPTDQHQGEVYRIIFVHVPSAFSGFFAALMLCVQSVMSLRSANESSLTRAKAWAEVGLLYTILTLATGSIWGKPTWGTWWTWDARLTTTFVLALMYAGYLLLYASLPEGGQRIRTCAIVGVLIFADVPIIYKSVTWWRTLHQPYSMLREGGSSMSPEILWLLIAGIFINILGTVWLARERWRNLTMSQEVEQLSYAQLR